MDWKEEDSSTGRVDYPEMARLRRKKRRRRATFLAWSLVAALLLLVGGSSAFLIAGNREKKPENPAQNRQEADEALRTQVLGEKREKQKETKSSVLSPTDLRNEQVRETVAGMTLEEKVAGLFVVSVDQLEKTGGRGKEEKDAGALTRMPVGGLVFTKEKFVSVEELHSFLQQIKKQSSYPLFLLPEGDGSWLRKAAPADASVSESVQEGGQENDRAALLEPEREDSSNFEPEREDSSNFEPEAEDWSNGVEEEAKETGQFLKNLGFNLCLQPCANLTDAGEESTRDSLETDADPDLQVLSQRSVAIVRGLQAGGIWPAAGNFPVAGAEDAAGKEGVTECQKDMGRLQTEDFVPFRNCMSQDVPLIQMSNVVLTRADIENLPCSLSSGMIEGQLRRTLGYDGIVMTDALNQRAVTDRFTSGTAAVDALLAGADLLYLPENFTDAYQGVLDAVHAGTLTEERIDTSLSRIYKIKLSQSE